MLLIDQEERDEPVAAALPHEATDADFRRVRVGRERSQRSASRDGEQGVAAALSALPDALRPAVLVGLLFAYGPRIGPPGRGYSQLRALRLQRERQSEG